MVDYILVTAKLRSCQLIAKVKIFVEGIKMNWELATEKGIDQLSLITTFKGIKNISSGTLKDERDKTEARKTQV